MTRSTTTVEIAKLAAASFRLVFLLSVKPAAQVDVTCSPELEEQVESIKSIVVTLTSEPAFLCVEAHETKPKTPCEAILRFFL